MASIRKMCCNDLLDMNHILMGQIATTGKDSYGSLLYYDILCNPDYALVAVSPGNRILGFITARIQGEGTERICDITEIFYRDAGLPEISDMLIQTIVEKADKLGKVYFVEADVPLNNQKFLNLFEKHGFTWDDKQLEGSSKRLRKDLLRNRLLEAHDNSWFGRSYNNQKR
ncbi:hypothetical protein MKW98_017207 [Papaver atlanticum]|uniref:N-acetyltransferase domain-containing protein n=1 Tax=Papaver atlanticum TaxID=357466 RepID=A0AAD4XCD2_9MAGN|nr:hypothetical protein MKW98_017207 [Papaver atlanticum]